MFAGSFAPTGWMLCEGQTLALTGNEELFSVIETTYGGDGHTTFNLPDLRGRLPIHRDDGHAVGASGGTEAVRLSAQQMPVHGHSFVASLELGDTGSPAGAVPAQGSGTSLYSDVPSTVTASHEFIADPARDPQPHSNVQPYMCINFIISVTGTPPSP